MAIKELFNFLKFTYGFLKGKFKQNQNYLNMQKDGGFLLKGNNHIMDSTIKEHSYLSLNSIVYCCDIGKFCSIGPNVIIGYGDHPTDFISTSPRVFFREIFYDIEKKPVKEYYNSHKRVSIGNDVWIGAQCFIKNGVSIGDGAIIGAGSIVLKDIPPYSIAVGCPARVIKKRFRDHMIQALLDLRWWDLDHNSLKDIESFFSKSLTDEIIEEIKLRVYKVDTNE